MITKNLLFIGVGMILSVFIMNYFDQFGLDENYIENQKGISTDGKIVLWSSLGFMFSALFIQYFINKRALQNKPTVND